MFEPEQCRSKMQESHETSCEFFIASENTSVPLDFVDETFDDVAFSVAESVIVAWLLAIAAGRDDRLYLLSCEQRFSFCPAVLIYRFWCMSLPKSADVGKTGEGSIG